MRKENDRATAVYQACPSTTTSALAIRPLDRFQFKQRLAVTVRFLPFHDAKVFREPDRIISFHLASGIFLLEIDPDRRELGPYRSTDGRIVQLPAKYHF